MPLGSKIGLTSMSPESYVDCSEILFEAFKKEIRRAE